MLFLFFQLFCFVCVSNAHEIIVSSNIPIPDAIQSIEHKGKYISLIDSNCVLKENVYVENNTYMYISEPVGQNLWNLDSLDGIINREYNYLYTGNGVNVYVIDSGIVNNSDFENRILKGTSFIGNSTLDCNNHGTHVASLIGSKTYGVAKKVNIVPVRVFDCTSTTPVFTVISAVYWVIKQKRGVVNLSLSGGYNSILNKAIQDLIDEGFIVVVAAGNDAADACQFSPSSVKSALVVGCLNNFNDVCSYSNKGSCVTIFAPGDYILGINAFGPKPIYKSGTSMASPHVAGVAAMIYEKYPGITQGFVKDLMTSISANGTFLRAFEGQFSNCKLSKALCTKNPLCVYKKNKCTKANLRNPAPHNHCTGLTSIACNKELLCKFSKRNGCQLNGF